MARLFTLLLLCSLSLFARADAPVTWTAKDAQGQPEITLYFFWSQTCPHCAEAHPFVDALAEHYPWIKLEAHKVSDADTLPLWRSVAAETGVPANSVPYLAYCGQATVGYNGHGVTGQFLLSQLKACYERNGGVLDPNDPGLGEEFASSAPAQGGMFSTCSSDSGEGTCGLDSSEAAPATAIQPVNLPFIGMVAPESLSLPVLTVVLAGVDAFNPCAFFVLLFLLSIMVNAKSRTRMLIVGGIFVFFSGFIYFLFMSAWLNIFALLGGSDGGWIMMAAGFLALTAGFINLREYVTQKGDVSLSMSAENRGALIKRMGQLTKASSLPTMIAGTVVLSILANTYELLCTAGFPMIYTSVLTLHDLPSSERYFYLVMYNLVYVIPLALIVLVFSLTMGKRKLTEKEGQTLKLMSGIMMMGMGAMLVIDPMLLQNAVLAIGLIVASIIVTLVVATARKTLEKRRASQG
ncbi:thioredoxin family protein [Ferrimonas balearica]|uniref:thioredoxin family protein n=1 Tax=Ferrimonas balearica TaxID=44012 RepID=UPI001C56F63B|nr:thioredoxin family protein [Ferrimonas balearica]MBW3139683.1 thioredoxin family protein [Ferrimonas balearica]MBY6107211.1 thioredoxin family protein [Ferrimonas balearica]MBY6224233.1 thioredoxin family protein [Ferrimonas balearica]